MLPHLWQLLVELKRNITSICPNWILEATVSDNHRSSNCHFYLNLQTGHTFRLQVKKTTFSTFHVWPRCVVWTHSWWYLCIITPFPSWARDHSASTGHKRWLPAADDSGFPRKWPGMQPPRKNERLEDENILKMFRLKRKQHLKPFICVFGVRLLGGKLCPINLRGVRVDGFLFWRENKAHFWCIYIILFM